MPRSYGIAGQAAPAADTPTTLYTVPASTSFVQSTLAICNRSPDAVGDFSVAVVPYGGTLANEHYIAYTTELAAKKSVFLTLGLSLSAGDFIVVKSSTALLSFSLFGSELTTA